MSAILSEQRTEDHELATVGSEAYVSTTYMSSALSDSGSSVGYSSVVDSSVGALGVVQNARCSNDIVIIIFV